MNKLLPLALALAGAALAGVVLAAPADEETELRRLILSLNSVLSDPEAQEKKIEELTQDTARAKRLLALARKMNDEKGGSLSYGANFILGNVALELRDFTQGEPLLAQAVKQGEQLHSDQKVTMAYLSWIDLRIAEKKHDDAEALCKKLLEREAEDENGRWVQIGQAYGLRKLIQILAVRGKADEALKKLKDYNQESEFVLETKAWVFTYQDKTDEAVAIYEQLYKTVENKESQAAQRERWARMLASLYGDQGKLDKATALLQSLLKKAPDDDGLNNDLGYMWAEHGQKLDEAEKMIRKAVDSKPANSSYQDSLAWVLFKQKKYDEAKKHMLKAVALPKAHNVELFDHLGDVHAALGEKAEAQAAWKKAVDLATGSGRDQKRKAEVEKKLRAGEGGGVEEVVR